MKHKFIYLLKILAFFFWMVANFSSQAVEPSYIYIPTDNAQEPINEALKAINLTRENCAFSLSNALAQDRKYECPAYQTLLYNPFQIPYFTSHIEYNFECYRDNFLRTMIFMANRTGVTVARGYFTTPLAGLEARLEKSSNPLILALEELYATAGSSFGEKDAQKVMDIVKDIPQRVRFETARILITSAQAIRWQRKALEKVVKSDYKFLLENIPQRLTPPPPEQARIPTISEEWERDRHTDLRPLIELVDAAALFCGALDLMASLEKTRAAFAEAPVKERFSAEFDTPFGRIILNGVGENNKYNADVNYLLIMDFGGDDVYTGGGANRSVNEPVSILLDFAGNDSYIQSASRLKPAFGAGVLGYGFLFDFAGDDKYVCPQLTEGCGMFGVGWLVDFAGNDTYESVRYAQGFAHCGLGLLYDRSGNDVYYCLNSAQGCGFTFGCGMLVDEGGNDEYIANDSDIRFPSAQTRSHNRSIAQGVGMGDRADEKDGHSMPGGIGILIDKSGNDRYSAGVFAQGNGFWDGIGILIDSSGNDIYNGVWYTQGAGVHGGIGVLCDRDGNDSYTATLHASQGIGHDSAIGFFLDEKGNDSYRSPRLSLGCANENGFGFFFDLAGDDHYELSSEESMGRAQFSKFGTMREDQLGVGLFVDAAGNDEYIGPHGSQNRLWVQQPSHGIRLRSELGVGIDGDFEHINLRLRPLTTKPPNVDW